ncbi:hypothetical protein AKG09_06310 [Neisseria sp. 83E34]|nr:hypothetical protein AKG09_06310 [Neisseria sp. 83E34]
MTANINASFKKNKLYHPFPLLFSACCVCLITQPYIFLIIFKQIQKHKNKFACLQQIYFFVAFWHALFKIICLKLSVF